MLRQQNRKMTTELQNAYEFDKLVFTSDSMIEVCNLARLAAVTDLPVLIQGETGTGKKLMARAVQGWVRLDFPRFRPRGRGYR